MAGIAGAGFIIAGYTTTNASTRVCFLCLFVWVHGTYMTPIYITVVQWPDPETSPLCKYSPKCGY